MFDSLFNDPKMLIPDLDTSANAPIQAADPEYRAKVENAAEKFESIFITQILREMRRATQQISPGDSVFHDSAGDGMLDYADTLVASAMASQRAFGIADCLITQLLPNIDQPQPDAKPNELA